MNKIYEISGRYITIFYSALIYWDPIQDDVLAISPDISKFYPGRGASPIGYEGINHVVSCIKSFIECTMVRYTTEVPLEDLPLYIGWIYKSPKFLDLLKAGCHE